MIYIAIPQYYFVT